MTVRLYPGQRLTSLPGGTWNQFCDTKKRVDQLLSPRTKFGDNSGVTNLSVEVRNTTGSDITVEFPVLAIDGPVVNYTDRNSVIFDGIQLKGITPTSSTTIHDIVVVQGAIATNAFRSGTMRGLTWCLVNVADEGHTHAAPTNGENTKLASGTDGAKVLWKESGTGDKRALILLESGGGGGDLSLVFGKVTEEISAASGWSIADAGVGMWQELDANGDDVGSPIEVINRQFDVYIVNTPLWVQKGVSVSYEDEEENPITEEVALAMIPGCASLA